MGMYKRSFHIVWYGLSLIIGPSFLFFFGNDVGDCEVYFSTSTRESQRIFLFLTVSAVSALVDMPRVPMNKISRRLARSVGISGGSGNNVSSRYQRMLELKSNVDMMLKVVILKILYF